LQKPLTRRGNFLKRQIRINFTRLCVCVPDQMVLRCVLCANCSIAHVLAHFSFHFLWWQASSNETKSNLINYRHVEAEAIYDAAEGRRLEEVQ
jgi:hypothetical protein